MSVTPGAVSGSHDAASGADGTERREREDGEASDSRRTGPDAQEREHFEQVRAYEAQGKCWASGFPLPICKATICDCFDYPEIKPADDATVLAYDGGAA